MKAQRGDDGLPAGPADNERVLRWLAKVTVNPAVAHGLDAHVGTLQVGRLADAVLWAPEHVGVRPELVVKAGIAAWGASGDGNATTMLCEPTRVTRQIGALGAAPARLSLAFLAGAAMDADLPTTRERARVEGCRGLRPADMVRNDRRGTVRVDPRTAAVTLDGEPVAAEPVGRLAFGPRHLLGLTAHALACPAMATRPAPYTSPLAEGLAGDLLERFLRYARVDTQSARDRTRSPSTPGQLELGRLLVDELRRDRPAGRRARRARLRHGHAARRRAGAGRRPGRARRHEPGRPRRRRRAARPPRLRRRRRRAPRGGTVLDPATMPELTAKAGHDLVTSPGDTLLGADDKAGVAEIMAAVAHLAAHPELPRPTLRVCFTPDEEIGEGATLFDLDRFGARCAYTVDGSRLGELQDETFSAAEVRVRITGVDVHPGFATGKLVHAGRLAARVSPRCPPIA